LLVLFFGQKLFGQALKPTKAQLIEIFKSSIHQDSKRKIQTDSNPWLICNKDSSFYKLDTLYLYDNHNYYYQPENCCDFIGWTFYKTTAIVQREIHICNEPPTAKMITDKDFYIIAVTEQNNQAVIKVFRKKQLVDKLKDGNIIEARKKGQIIFYSLRSENLKILRPFFKIINQQNLATQTV